MRLRVGSRQTAAKVSVIRSYHIIHDNVLYYDMLAAPRQAPRRLRRPWAPEARPASPHGRVRILGGTTCLTLVSCLMRAHMFSTTVLVVYGN